MMGTYLKANRERALFSRHEAARVLKRFYLLERSLVLTQAAWLPALARFEVKTGLPRHLWQDMKTGQELRERVFELKFPSRLLEVGDDAPLAAVFDAGRDAPDALALVSGLAGALKPALLSAYRQYFQTADPVADGPTARFLEVAILEKERQLAELGGFRALLAEGASAAELVRASTWTAGLIAALGAVGSVSADPQVSYGDRPAPGELPGRMPFSLPQTTSQDDRFARVRFYWPDNFEPSTPYGEGVDLQLRSAVSHLNETWALETAGVILYAFADSLGWEFVVDAARWCYDESRHAYMGFDRLRSYGFVPAELPLASFLYDSGRGQDPLYRMGMLSYFETKNIGKKTTRARRFEEYGDAVSQFDMEFDWADEGMHAAFGARWIKATLEARGEHPELEARKIAQRCQELVDEEIARSTPEDFARTRELVERLKEHARKAVGSGGA